MTDQTISHFNHDAIQANFGTFKQPKTIVGIWMLRHRTRKQLRRVPSHILRDVGMSKLDAEIEAQKPFWIA